MTVAEYEKLKPPKEGWYELRHGELMKAAFPLFKHNLIQHRIRAMLERVCGTLGYAMTEMSFRPAPEYEVWAADVAYVSRERGQQALKDGRLMGSPEIVIEVLSPSNTATEMLDRERTCFTGGCVEFWSVDPTLRIVRVTRRDGTVSMYAEGDLIALRLFGDATLEVSEIFAE